MKKNRKKLLTIRECFGRIYRRSSELTKKYRYAALAQLVERRLGKAEVGGSNPLGSFLNLLIISGDFLLYTKMLGAKGILPPMIPDCSVLRTLTILKNIHNPLIFLRKMAAYSCFWRVPRSKILSQASLHRILDLLTLVSYKEFIKTGSQFSAVVLY